MLLCKLKFGSSSLEFLSMVNLCLCDFKSGSKLCSIIDKSELLFCFIDPDFAMFSWDRQLIDNDVTFKVSTYTNLSLFIEVNHKNKRIFCLHM